jgi:hypothetical protein
MTERTATAIGLSVVAIGLLYVAATVAAELEGVGEDVHACPHCGCLSFPRTRLNDGTRYNVRKDGRPYGVLLRCRADPGHAWVRMHDTESTARRVRGLPWRAAEWMQAQFAVKETER